MMVQTHRVVSSINTQCVPEFELWTPDRQNRPIILRKARFSEPLDSTYSVRFSKFDRFELLMSINGKWFGRFSRLTELLH